MIESSFSTNMIVTFAVFLNRSMWSCINTIFMDFPLTLQHSTVETSYCIYTHNGGVGGKEEEFFEPRIKQRVTPVTHSSVDSKNV